MFLQLLVDVHEPVRVDNEVTKDFDRIIPTEIFEIKKTYGPVPPAQYVVKPEVRWTERPFRLGNFAQAMGDQVSVFLIGKGVEIESLDTDRFNISEQVECK